VILTRCLDAWLCRDGMNALRSTEGVRNGMGCGRTKAAGSWLMTPACGGGGVIPRRRAVAFLALDCAQDARAAAGASPGTAYVQRGVTLVSGGRPAATVSPPIVRVRCAGGPSAEEKGTIQHARGGIVTTASSPTESRACSVSRGTGTV
jgi:hypothetical protein